MSASIIAELTADGRTIILIAAGRDYEIAQADKLLQTLTPKFTQTKPPGAMQCPLSWAAVVQLSVAYKANWKPGPKLAEWIAEQIRARTTFPDGLSVQPPAGLVPYSWQVEGAALIRATGSALIFDEAGTGKTISTILGIVERRAAGFDVGPVIVVSPAAVMDSWVSHFEAWAPGFKAVSWRGTPLVRQKLIGTADVYVASYDTVRNDASPTTSRPNPLLQIKAKTIVCDELHRTKSAQAAQSKAVRRLASKADNFIGLSGTPITHHSADLWPGLVCLSQGAWPSRERWVHHYCLSAPSDYGESILGLNPRVEPEFRLTLLGQHRRVAKADVLKELPSKVYSVRTVELPPAYRKSYDQMEAEMLAEMPDGEELSVMGVLAQLTRLGQMASAAADVRIEKEQVWDQALGCDVEKIHQHVTLKNPSWKVDALLEVLEERPGQPVVTFAPSRQLIVLAGAAAEKVGYSVGYIMGGQKASERTENVEKFQRGELDLICVTTGAGGVGLTLTASNCAVFLQRPYSLVEAMQSEDRCHRIGAERHSSIEIIDIVAKATIDTRVRAVLRERAGQLADLLQDSRIVSELLGGKNVKRFKKAS